MTLPLEIVHEICTFLDSHRLFQLERTSKQFFKAIQLCYAQSLVQEFGVYIPKRSARESCKLLVHATVCAPQGCDFYDGNNGRYLHLKGPSGVGKTSFSSLFRNRYGNTFPQVHIPTDGMRIRNRIYYQDFKLHLYDYAGVEDLRPRTSPFSFKVCEICMVTQLKLYPVQQTCTMFFTDVTSATPIQQQIADHVNETKDVSRMANSKMKQLCAILVVNKVDLLCNDNKIASSVWQHTMEQVKQYADALDMPVMLMSCKKNCNVQLLPQLAMEWMKHVQ